MYQINGYKPQKGDKYFNTTSNDGYSQCIQGKPTIKGLNVLCNCVGAGCGFYNRQYSLITGYEGMKYPYFNCNAENFIKRANQYYPELEIVEEPVEGGIMVWEGKGSLAGHVAFVIKCNSSNSVYTAESGYNSFEYANYTRTNSNGRWGMSSNYKYLGCIVNPAVGKQRSYEEPQPTPTEDYYKVNAKEGLWLLDDNGKKIKAYPLNTEVQYISNGYSKYGYNYYKVKVICDGKIGYMASEYLTKVENPSEDIKVGDWVVPTRLVNYYGVPVKQYDDKYKVTALTGDKATCSALRNGQYIVWASMNVKDLKKV